MLRLLPLTLLAAALTAAPASAQTTQKAAPARSKTAATKPRPAPTPAKTPTDGQGEYVAPGMTGAPDDRVTTDYENRPLKKPAAGRSTLSSQPAPSKPRP